MEVSNNNWKGLLQRREIWVPTWRGWLCLLFLLGGVGVLSVLGIYAFLSPYQPIQGNVLIVESWLDEKDLAETAQIFRAGSYDRIVMAGPLLDDDSFLKWRYPNAISRGDVTRAQLNEAGIADSLIVVVVRPYVVKDRTYHTALSVKLWLDQNAPSARLDLVSVGPHARRSWLLYDLALGSAYPLGIIAQTPQDYAPDNWWRSSQGVRSVLGELLAYFYAKFLFFP